mmetsp:Transcript_4762/g.10133  ORF Transcript_4762/g.10133 Transcript_4762/m.10133 type:complete len:200 (-) Transcript_4762:541-1140(-)
MVQDAVGQDLGGTELIASMNDRHFGRRSRQDQCIFHGGVPSSNDNHGLFGIQESITSGTRTHTAPAQFPFSRNLQPVRFGPRGNNNGVRFNGSSAIGHDFQWSIAIGRWFNGCNNIIFNRGSKMQGLMAHGCYQGWTRGRFSQSRIIFNIHTLALQLPSHAWSNNQGRQTSASTVNGGRPTGGSSSDDDHLLRVARGIP